MTTLLLLRDPKKWDSRQIEIARAAITDNASNFDILGNHFPKDGDAEFETIAEAFNPPANGSRRDEDFKQLEFLSEPTPKLSFGRYNVRPGKHIHKPGEDNINFATVYSRIGVVARCSKTDVYGQGMARFMFDEMIWNLLSTTKAGSKFQYAQIAAIRTSLPRLARAAKIHLPLGVITRPVPAKRGAHSVPLLLCTQIPKPVDKTAQIAQYELPLLLTQGIIAYRHRNWDWFDYYAYVVTLSGTVVTVSKVVMSAEYLERLSKLQPVQEDLQYHRSRPFDLVDSEGRREFVRLMIGVFRSIGSGAEKWIRDRHYSSRYVEWKR